MKTKVVVTVTDTVKETVTEKVTVTETKMGTMALILSI